MKGLLHWSVAEISVQGYRLCRFWKMFYANPVLPDFNWRFPDTFLFQWNVEMSWLYWPWQWLFLPAFSMTGTDLYEPWYTWTSNQWVIKFTTLLHLHCDIKRFYHSAHFSHTNVCDSKHMFLSYFCVYVYVRYEIAGLLAQICCRYFFASSF